MTTKRIGLALSGGGFRAAVFHIGVLCYLAEKRQLKNITYISTVSGGSLLIGLIYSLNGGQWPSSQVFLEKIEPKIKKYLTQSSLMTVTIKNLFIIPSNWLNIFQRVKILSYTLKYDWKIKTNLSNISKIPIWAVNATTSETGKSWRFTHEKMGDYVTNYVLNPNIPLSDIMAISAAFPGGFGPYRIYTKNYKWFKYKSWKHKEFQQSQPGLEKINLYDGGIYDNLGIEPMLSNTETFLRDVIDYLIVSDASKPLATVPASFFALKRAIRLLDITTDQIRSLRARMLFHEFSKNSNGLYLKIGHTLDNIFNNEEINHKLQHYKNSNGIDPGNTTSAKNYPTNLSKMSENNYNLLLAHGKAVAAATSFAYASL